MLHLKKTHSISSLTWNFQISSTDKWIVSVFLHEIYIYQSQSIYRFKSMILF